MLVAKHFAHRSGIDLAEAFFGADFGSAMEKTCGNNNKIERAIAFDRPRSAGNCPFIGKVACERLDF